ncbi:MAG: hypothetical protein WCI57_01550 [Candidatus Berkelbacteria bacterium]
MNNIDDSYRNINDYIFDSEINRADGKVVLLLVWNEVAKSRLMNHTLLAFAKDHPEIVYRRIIGLESKRILKYVGGTMPITLIFKKGELKQAIAGTLESEYIQGLISWLGK